MLSAWNLIHRRMSDFTIHPIADTIGDTGPLLSRTPAPAAPARAKLESLTTAIGPPNSPPRDELLAAISSASFLAESPEWYSYDLPGGLGKSSLRGKFRGQRQKWFALRFEGEESEIDIHRPAGGHKPEFDAWRWEALAQLPKLIIPFKRPVYEKVIEAFGHLAKQH